MKLLIILSVVACSYAEKLDRTYLPPISAATAGGSPGSLTAPESGPFRPGSSTFGFDQSKDKFSSTAPGQTTYGQPSVVPNNQATGPGLSQPSAPGYQASNSQYQQSIGQTGYGKSSSPTSFGQESVSSYGQPSRTNNNKPTGQGFNQISTSGSQAPSSQYGQSTGKNGVTGFGKSSEFGSTFGQTPTSVRQSSTTFGQSSTPLGQSPQEQINYQAYQPERAQASIEKNAEILRYDNQNDGDSFAYSFETSNGISVEESGVATNGVRAQGSFAYTDDDGQVIRVTYTADENGYQPQGDHLPTPHPIPEEILRSIDENAKAAAAGTQEGAYNPDEDTTGFAPQQHNGAGQRPGASQNAYKTPGQAATSEYNAPGSAASGNIPSSGVPNYQGFNKPGQSATGFISGQSLTQSGYEYNQPQTSSSFGRAPGSSNLAGQYSPESATSNQESRQRSSPSGQGFVPTGSNGQNARSSFGSSNQPGQYRPEFGPSGAQGPRPGFTPSGKPGSKTDDKLKGSISEPSLTGNGFALGFDQAQSSPAAQKPGQYQPSKSSGIGSSMNQPTPYQYNRPDQQSGDSQLTGAQPGFRSTNGEQSTPTKTFGAPRQPPSFTEEEGYKY